MIHQNDGRFRPEIKMKGCYYMSLIWLAHHYTNISLSAEIINNGFYNLFLRRKWMRSDDKYSCFILKPSAILNWLGLEVDGVRKEIAPYTLESGEIAIQQWKKRPGISHFVVGGQNNCVAYDPWFSEKGGSIAVREGELISYRVFTRR